VNKSEEHKNRIIKPVLYHFIHQISAEAPGYLFDRYG